MRMQMQLTVCEIIANFHDEWRDWCEQIHTFAMCIAQLRSTNESDRKMEPDAPSVIRYWKAISVGQ